MADPMSNVGHVQTWTIPVCPVDGEPLLGLSCRRHGVWAADAEFVRADAYREVVEAMPNEDPTSGPLSDVFLEADPEMAAFMARHTALLERVTALERALEKTSEVVDDDWFSREARMDKHPREELREIIAEALNG